MGYTRKKGNLNIAQDLLTNFLGSYPLLLFHISGWSDHQLDHSRTIFALQQSISQHLEP